MENLGIIIMILIIAVTAIGFVVGLVKGYVKINTWTSVVALTTFTMLAVSSSFKTDFGYIPIEGAPVEMSQEATSAIVALAVTVALAIVFTMLSAGLHKLVKNGMEKYQKLDAYKNYDEVEENNRRMADAAANNDMASYNRLSKRKIGGKSGGWGIVDKLLGGLTLAVKAFVICGIITACLLTVLDFVPEPELQNALKDVLNQTWDNVKPLFMDGLVVMIITLVINTGIKNGASGMLWGLLMLALAAGLSYLAYYIVFETATFDNAASALGENLLGNLEGDFAELGSNIAKGLIMAGLCIFMWIISFIISRLGPGVINSIRSHSVTRVIDGVFGVIITAVLALAILLFLGNVLQSMLELDFMQDFNAYFEDSSIARYVYGDNLLAKIGIMPLRLNDLLS